MELEKIEPTVHYANFTVPAAAEWPGRRLSDHELILAVRGNFELLLPETGESFLQQTGQTLFIYPGEYHTYRVLSGAKEPLFSCIHFDFDRETGGLGPLPRLISAGRVFELLTALFRRLPEECRKPGRFQPAISANILKEILFRLAEAAGSGPDGDEQPVAEMTAYLDRHLTEHPGRTELSRKFFLSKPYINRLFLKKLGESPTAYVHRRLAHRGYELMLYGKHSAKEAAAELGFANQFHFSRVFKKVFGFAPSHLCSHPRKG